MSFMNIPYELEKDDWPDECRFHTIWKVHADDSYQNVRPEGFPQAGLFVTFEGKGHLSLRQPDGRERRFDLHAGSYVFVEENIPIAYRCQDGDWKFYFAAFRGLAMARGLELPIGEPSATAKMPEAVHLCERLIDSLIVQPAGYGYSARIALQELHLLFARERTFSSANRYPELDEVLFLMHRNIGKPLDMDDLMRQAGLSRTAFYSRFRSMTGLSPNQYMLELKLASAKASLDATNLSVKEIAAALRFYDEFHFSKTFKQRYGVSPRAYRQGSP